MIEGIKSKNLILLTGAGFTHNFGGFLATEMWSKIFNHPEVQGNEKLKNILQTDFDFESVYSKVLTKKSFNNEDRISLQLVVEGAYKRLDDSIRNYKFTSSNPKGLDVHKLFGDLFQLFVGSGKESGFLFTLNQDLYLERKQGYKALGVPPFPQEFYHIGTKIEQGNFVTLPTDITKTKSDLVNHAGLHYIKLHGSYGWKSSADGSTLMVLGMHKDELIKREPLLRSYFDIFRKVIGECNKKLLIIGYGFRDKHINDMLVKGIEDNNLRLFIINPTNPEEFSLNLNRNTFLGTQGIWEGVAGYFPYTLREIFSPDQERTSYLDEIKETLTAI